jgi:hypothetical protein
MHTKPKHSTVEPQEDETVGRGGPSISYAELVGDMYARWVLDCLVEIAYAVSKDYVARPEFHKDSEVPIGIVDLRMEYGTKSGFPDRTQRQEINSPIFGASDGYLADNSNDKFRVQRKPLFDACTTLSLLTASTAAASLKPSVTSSLVLLQQRLKSFDGASIRRSYHQVVHVSELAFSILTSSGISKVFGVSPSPSNGWPLESTDFSGSQLIESISGKLPLAPEHVFKADRFQRLQRVAQQGREALRAILDADAAAAKDFNGLVTSVYTWSSSLKDYSEPLKPL